jgi:protocatechuate 4,5-dioxygenase beta chain
MLKRISPGIIAQYPEAQAELASLELCREKYNRVHSAFEKMQEAIKDYAPEAIIMIGDDQYDMFDSSNNPALAIYTGSDPLWGRTGYDWDKPIIDRRKVIMNNHVDLSNFLLKGLLKKGFDMANCKKFIPVGKPESGLSHMAARIVPELDPSGEIPVICIFINEYFAPLPTSERCAQLGVALSELLADRPEKVAICASGGLSHYPTKFNQGVIDVPFDTWVIERIARNDVDALKNLFTFDSDNLRSGTGEVRAWVSAAAAMNRPAEIIDYLPIHASFLGAGFAIWPEIVD